MLKFGKYILLFQIIRNLVKIKLNSFLLRNPKSSYFLLLTLLTFQFLFMVISINLYTYFSITN